jgi:calcineurin-like phosphoesterase
MKQELKKFDIKNIDLVITNYEVTIALTKLENIEMKDFIKMDFQTFKNTFWFDNEDRYIHKDNHKIAYPKNLIDNGLTLMAKLINLNDFNSLRNIKIEKEVKSVYVNINEPYPIVFEFDKGNCLIVAPRIESD